MTLLQELRRLMRRTASSLTRPESGLVKVRVQLLGSALESGFESESLWAEPLPDGTYRIWNLPVFAYNLDMRAIVTCRPDPEGGLPVVTKVLEPGDCFVVRLYFTEKATDGDIQAVLNLLSERRVLTEKYSRLLWAVGFRSTDDYDWAGPALEPYVSRNVLSFESSFQVDEPQIGSSA